MSAHLAKNLSPFLWRAAVEASRRIGNLYIIWQNTIDLEVQLIMQPVQRILGNKYLYIIWQNTIDLEVQ